MSILAVKWLLVHWPDTAFWEIAPVKPVPPSCPKPSIGAHFGPAAAHHSVLSCAAASGAAPGPRPDPAFCSPAAFAHDGAEGLQAWRVQVQDVAVVDLGPDHYARLAAVSRLIQVLAAGRPVAKVAEAKKQHIDDGSLRRLVYVTAGGSEFAIRVLPAAFYAKATLRPSGLFPSERPSIQNNPRWRFASE